jgi:hypothetical protein
VQDQVALGCRALMTLTDRLELEGQVVAERAIEPEVGVRAREGRDDLAQSGEHGGAAAAFLLGEGARCFRYDYRDAGQPGARLLDLGLVPRAAAQGGAEHRQQHRAALVQRGGRYPPAMAGDLDARVDVTELPAAVPARVLHPRAEHPAAPRVNLPGQPGQLDRVEWRGGAAHPDARRGHEAGLVTSYRVHLGPSHIVGPGADGGHEKGDRR